MRAVYETGWQWASARTISLNDYMRGCRTHADIDDYSYIYLSNDRCFYHGDTTSLLGQTHMNSIRHLLEYCRRLPPALHPISRVGIDDQQESPF